MTKQVTWHIGRCNWSHGIVVYILKMAIVLHDKFDSWQEFQDKLDAYCKETYQSFIKDDSKTVESVNKTPKRAFPRRAPVCFREDVMRPLREETRTERDGAYRPQTAASWRRLR